MKIKIQDKNNEIIPSLLTHFEGKMNLARIKFFGLFISALCKVQTVGFEKLACAFDTVAASSSSLRRIQRFMSEYLLDTDLIARLIWSLLPHKPPFTIAMDRTNWKFGEANINVLVIAVVYQGVAFPLLHKLMPKRGNSNTQERIDITNRFIRLFGIGSIQHLVADREFVGEDWLEYLNKLNIKYHIRIRENFWVTDPRTGKQIKASWMFNDLHINEVKALTRIYYVNNQLCYLSGSKVKNKEGKPEMQIIVSFNKPEDARAIYKERWQIETAFRALKSSGFNIEDTHLQEMERIEKLFALVMVAFVWAFKVGIYLNEIKPIRRLKHRSMAKSFFKYGLEKIAIVLLNNKYQTDIDIFKFLSCT